MRNRVLLTVVLAMLVAAFALPQPALAGGNFKFSGRSADAFFFSVDGCVESWVSVFANHGKSQSPPGPWSSGGFAIVSISQYDFCTDTYLISGWGEITVDSAAFQIDRKLNWASLNATIPIYDWVSDSLMDASVSMDWTGVGELSRGSWHSHWKSPGCSVNDRNSGTFRGASASGTVSLGGTNYTPGPSEYAELRSTRTGTLVIGCS